MQPFSEVPIKPDVSDAAKPPEANVERPNETEGWKNSIELPDDTDGWQDSIELPNDTGGWVDSIAPPYDSVYKSVTAKLSNAAENDRAEKNLDNQELLSGFENGNIAFDEAKEALASKYAEMVNSNQPWKWNEDIPGGGSLSMSQRSEIKALAEKKDLIPQVPMTTDESGKKIALFRDAGLVIETLDLPKELWTATDAEQFKWLNNQIGGAIKGTTWHHSEIPGKMELVPFGIHNATYHNGGRSAGMWADAPR